MPSIVGVEVGKTSILCCRMDSDSPPKAPAKFARTYTPITLISDISGAQNLLELGDVFVIEPTGDYSKIWVNLLKANQKSVLRVNPRRVTALKELHNITSKSDRYDAAFLALYGVLNYQKPDAFLGEHAEELRTAVLRHTFLSRMTGNHQRRLWQLLSHEWPEVCRSANGSKPQQSRRWLCQHPPALWRFIAGEAIAPKSHATREAQLIASIGSGLSSFSKLLATQVCDLERQQYPIEKDIAQLLKAPEFKPYHSVFDEFGFGQMTRASLLARIYPFSQFLGPTGQPIRISVPSPKSDRRHRRNKSLEAFRMALGNGTRLHQSGQEARRRPAGPAQPRTSLYLHVKTKIVIASGKGVVAGPHYLQQHAVYYHSLSPQLPHKLRVSKVVSRLVKDLYRALLAEL